MTSEANGSNRPEPLRRLSPDQVRNSRFSRTSLARRGLDEEEVYRFTHRLAHELDRRDTEITKVIDENRRLKQALREWHGKDPDTGEPTSGEPGRGGSGRSTESVEVETAALMARAQQQIDAQVAQAELYCRQREEEAARRYEEIVHTARVQAQADAERVVRQYRSAAGATYSSDREQVQRQQVYLTALLHALDALASHLHATRQTFAAEVQKLAGFTDTTAPARPPAAPARTGTERQ